MAISSALADLLRENLDKVQAPDSYDSLHEKLKTIRPTREPPIIKESPENSYPLSRSDPRII